MSIRPDFPYLCQCRSSAVCLRNPTRILMAISQTKDHRYRRSVHCFHDHTGRPDQDFQTAGCLYGKYVSADQCIAVLLFALLIYLLTKLIIEKNEHSISMVKILGYENDEIVRLYLVSTSWVVAVSVLLSLWIATWTIKVIYVYMMAEFSGWLSLYIEPAIYWKMFLMGMAVYALVALLQFFRISKIPMETALKNIE